MASVRQRRNGYQALWRDHHGKQCGKMFRSKRDAERFAARVEVAKERGEYRDPKAGRRTVEEVADTWLGQKTGLNPGTISNYETVLRLYVLPEFGSQQVASLTPEQIVDWVSRCRARGVAPTSLAKSYRVLGAIMETAVDLRMIPSSPVLRKFRPTVKPAPEMQFLTREQVRDVAKAIGPHFSTLVWTAADTGMRKSELIGLRVKRVDLLRKTIDVAETLTEVRGKVIIGSTKTRSGRRQIPLTKHVAELLEVQMAGKAPDDFVFPAQRSEHIRATNFHRSNWMPAVKACGLTGLRFHDLRHTHVAWLIAANVPTLEITRRLGHKTVAFTLDRYGHLFPGMEQAASALDAQHEEMEEDTGSNVTSIR